MKSAFALKANRPANLQSSCVYYERIPDRALPPLPQKVVKIIELFNGPLSLAQVCEKSQISEEQGEAVVKKLTALGLIQARSQHPTRTKTSRSDWEKTLRGLPMLGTKDFSAVEEAFFSAELEPIDECDEPFETLSEKINSVISDIILRLRRTQAL
jgi:hypothetical protein